MLSAIWRLGPASAGLGTQLHGSPMAAAKPRISGVSSTRAPEGLPASQAATYCCATAAGLLWLPGVAQPESSVVARVSVPRRENVWYLKVFSMDRAPWL